MGILVVADHSDCSDETNFVVVAVLICVTFIMHRLQLWIRCIRRRLARKQVLDICARAYAHTSVASIHVSPIWLHTRGHPQVAIFFRDFGVQRLTFVVSRFRWNVARLQVPPAPNRGRNSSFEANSHLTILRPSVTLEITTKTPGRD